LAGSKPVCWVDQLGARRLVLLLLLGRLPLGREDVLLGRRRLLGRCGPRQQQRRDAEHGSLHV